ncbi:hypothetical protein ES319_A02G137400v1 [Gossypium barbadense]|uniref:Uncharacterized protein n=2 Tax=Gossypium TaxID=3633 RepID=A0A5J5WP86_GOSBA|nr:hypothetical protein ES319_A02G137400v1 [Gossypium barbadense]TYH28555.1 hypothetical protein ES288_A02G152800v1 [Gossypium darwinii]
MPNVYISASKDQDRPLPSGSKLPEHTVPIINDVKSCGNRI